MSSRISLATYLFRRLRQNGVTAIYGVPGDFTLRAIDQMKAAGVEWIGTCNELNAGYAADGYARVKGLGAILTTYGVGELSAINAISGSFAEHVPVVHIAGVPSSHPSQPSNIVHHALPDRPADVFAKMHQAVTAAQCAIEGPATDSAVTIDRILAAALQHRRPVYMQLPTQATDLTLHPQRLDTPLERNFTANSLEERTEKYAVELIARLQRATFPLLLVDRSRDLEMAREELNDFVRHSGIPTLTMPSGASMIDHSIPNYLGVHSGSVGRIDTMPLLDQADLILAFGPIFSDTQTLGWKTVPEPSKTIQIPRWNFQTGEDRMFAPHNFINTNRLLTLLKERLWPTSLRLVTSPPPLLKDFPNFRELPSPDIIEFSAPIDQTSFYTRVNSYLRAHDIILLGNATPILGGRDFVLPSPTCRVISSGLSFSIGHMLPAALGAAVAQQHSDTSQSTSVTSYAITHDSTRGRVVLFDGDGSFQVTVQELSTIIRLRLNVTIFILNNAGYAYERLIHGLNEDYNDIANWDYLSLPAAFGGREALLKAAEEGEEYGISCACLKTWADLDAFLQDQRFDNGFDGKGKRGLKLVDVRVGRTDVPARFKAVFEQAGEKLRNTVPAQNEEDDIDDEEGILYQKKSDNKPAEIKQKDRAFAKQKTNSRPDGTKKSSQYASSPTTRPETKRLVFESGTKHLNLRQDRDEDPLGNVESHQRLGGNGRTKNRKEDSRKQETTRHHDEQSRGNDEIPRSDQQNDNTKNVDLPAQDRAKLDTAIRRTSSSGKGRNNRK